MLWHFPSVMIGVEQLVREGTAWASEVALIEFLNVWVFVAKANFLFTVDVPERSTTVNVGVDTVNDWLTATTDTATRASHDFNEVVMGFAGLDVVQKLAGIA